MNFISLKQVITQTPQAKSGLFYGNYSLNPVNRTCFKGMSEDRFEKNSTANIMSENEFESKKTELKLKLKNSPINKMKLKLNKYNILVLEKISENKQLYTNKNLLNNLENIMYYTDSLCQAEIKTHIVNKVSSKNLSKNILVNNKLGELVRYTNTKEKLKITDKILDDKNLYSNDKLMNQIDKFFRCANTPEKVKVFDKILSNKNLYSASGFPDKALYLIESVTKPEYADIKIKILNNYIEKKLNENKKIEDKIYEIARITNTPEQSEVITTILNDNRLCTDSVINRLQDYTKNISTPSQSLMANLLLSNKKLYDNKNIVTNTNDIIKVTTTPEEYNAKKEVINKYLSEERLNKTPSIANNIGDIIFIVRDKNYLPMLTVADRYIRDENLYKTQSVRDNADKFISSATTVDKVKVINKIFDNEKLYGAPKIANDIHIILDSVKDSIQADIKTRILDDYVNKKIYTADKIAEKIILILFHSNSENQYKIANKILSDPKLYENKTVIENVSKILHHSEHDYPFKIIEKIMSEPKLYTNKSIMKNLSKIAVIDETEATSKLHILDKFLKEENLHNDDDIINNIGNILSESTAFANYVDSNSYDNYSKEQKMQLLNMISNISEEHIEHFNKLGFDTIKIQQTIIELFNKKPNNITTPKEKQTKFLTEIMANNNDTSENAIKTYHFSKFEKNGIPLKYKREDFINDINKCLDSISSQESKEKIMTHFGLEYGENDIDGLFNNMLPDESFSESEKNTAKKIRNLIENYTLNNETTIEDATTKMVLDSLIQGLPEFATLIGKVQHEIHNYSVDIHTLKVLQSALNNPKYKKLSDESKTVLKFATLLHDSGKKGRIIDDGHELVSAEYVDSILEKFNFTPKIKSRIIEIIKNHHWFKQYNIGELNVENAAFNCRYSEDLLITEILAAADLENINDVFHYEVTGTNDQKTFNDYMETKFKEVEEAVKKLHSKSNIVFDTPFMSAEKKFPVKKVVLDGEPVELRVLDLNDKKTTENLFEYGFAPNVTKHNARFNVHMVDESNITKELQTTKLILNNPLIDSIFSTSLIGKDNNKTFASRKFGFIFDIDQSNIINANSENIDSGKKKTKDSIINIMFLYNDTQRTVIRDKLLNILKNKGIELTLQEYAKLAEYLQSKKYITQIKDFKINKKTVPKTILQESLKISADELLNTTTNNETISIMPRIKGLIAIADKLEHCPKPFLKFAKENNLPIILMKDSINSSTDFKNQ